MRCHLICCLHQHFTNRPSLVSAELETAEAGYCKHKLIPFREYPDVSLRALIHYSFASRLSLDCLRTPRSCCHPLVLSPVRPPSCRGPRGTPIQCPRPTESPTNRAHMRRHQTCGYVSGAYVHVKGPPWATLRAYAGQDGSTDGRSPHTPLHVVHCRIGSGQQR